MNRDNQIVKTSAIGILGNILLVIAKAIIGILAGAISIVLDAVNNLTDALSSVITIIGTKLANKKPDKKHPYGHGRIEYITSSIIGMIIFFAGALAIYEAIISLTNHETAQYSVYSFVVITIAILAKLGLGLFFKKRGALLNSDALSASGLDALWDVALSFGTLIGAIITHFAGVSIEGYIGIIIGAFIIKSSIDVFRESVSKIIGERTDAELVRQIHDDILQFPEVHGVYDLIINNYGNDKNIGSVHIEVNDDMTAKQIQVLDRAIASMAYEKYKTIMTVGVYAKNETDEEAMKIKQKIDAIIKEYPEIIQTHGFYCDFATKLINLDIIIDFAAKDEKKIYDEVKERIAKENPGFSVYLVLDRDFAVS